MTDELMKRDVENLKAWQHKTDVVLAVLQNSTTSDKKHIDERFDRIENQYAQTRKVVMVVVTPVLVGFIGYFLKFIIAGGLVT